METTKFTTKENSHEIEAVKYLTGYQLEELRDFYLEKSENVKIDEAGKPITSVNKETIKELEEKTMKMVIISVDGKTDDICNLVRSLEADDYLEVQEYIATKTKKKGKTN